MLVFLALLCVLWIAYWSYSLWRDKDIPSPVYISRYECANCAQEKYDNHSHTKRGSETSRSDNVSRSTNNSKPIQNSRPRTEAAVSPALDNTNLNSATNGAKTSPATQSAKSNPAPNNAKSTAASISAKSNSAPNGAHSNPTLSNTKSGAVPLFNAPTESDDLKEIKGVGVVMESTLNDLGITTFKQLAEFKDAEVRMVSDALSELNAGFGDRISRDEWVKQAKVLAAK